MSDGTTMHKDYSLRERWPLRFLRWISRSAEQNSAPTHENVNCCQAITPTTRRVDAKVLDGYAGKFMKLIRHYYLLVGPGRRFSNFFLSGSETSRCSAWPATHLRSCFEAPCYPPFRARSSPEPRAKATVTNVFPTLGTAQFSL